METRAASNGVFPPLLILTALLALPTSVYRLSGALPPPLRVPAPFSFEIFQQFSIDRACRNDVVTNCRVKTNLFLNSHPDRYLSFPDDYLYYVSSNYKFQWTSILK